MGVLGRMLAGARLSSIGGFGRRWLVPGVLAAMLLVACSGGGGGSGGGGDPPASTFPAQVQRSVSESSGQNSTPIFVATTFQFYAPTSESPAGLQLSGPDAAVFNLIIEVTDPPTAAGYRTVTIRLEPLVVLNFEDPQDANGDNVYQFALTGSYRGAQLRTDFSITVTNIADPAEVGARYISGAATGQAFGQRIAAVPDVSGDGKAELGVSIISGVGGASGYVVSSEFFEGLTGLATSVSTLGNGGVTFLDGTATGALEFNRVSGVADSEGASLMVSEVGASAGYLLQDPLYSQISGAQAPASVAGVITYANGGADSLEAHLLGDVNGDGLADIFTRTITTGTARGFGLILGRTTASAPPPRTMAADIAFTYSTATHPSDPFDPYDVSLNAQLVPDVDGDGARDLVIISPRYNWMGPQDQRGALWLIRSSVLQSAGPLTVDLDALTPQQGFKFTGRIVRSVASTSDFDGDGYRTLVIGAESTVYAIDANDFGALDPATIPVTGPNGPPPLFGPASFLVLDSGLVLSDGGDLDNDGRDEVLGTYNGLTLDVLRGSSIRAAMTDPSYNPANMPGRFQAQPVYPLSYFGNVLETGPAVYLPDSGLIALGSAPASPFSPANAESGGRIILIETADISAAMAANETILSLYLR